MAAVCCTCCPEVRDEERQLDVLVTEPLLELYQGVDAVLDHGLLLVKVITRDNLNISLKTVIFLFILVSFCSLLMLNFKGILSLNKAFQAKYGL